MRNSLERLLTHLWYSPRAYAVCWSNLLSPLSWLYGVIAKREKNAALATLKILTPQDPKIIVIGNITLGGTGKTPLLIALAKVLRSNGSRVGILSRGYGGNYIKRGGQPQLVRYDSDPREVGDEAVLIAQSLQGDSEPHCPVVVCPDRLRAMHWLCRQHRCDILLSDDGLQHYHLPRHMELVVVDGTRGFGNGKLLPAGPLREPLQRLSNIDALICHGDASQNLNNVLATLNAPCYPMKLSQRGLLPVNPAATQASEQLEDFQRCGTAIHAVAGIGNPERFFSTLRLSLPGIELIEHRYPDHHFYSEKDLRYTEKNTAGAGRSAIVMTTKDAVKCHCFAGKIDVPIYALDVAAEIDPILYQNIRKQLDI